MSHSCSTSSPPWFLLSKSNHNFSCKCCDPRICIFVFRQGQDREKSYMDIDVSKKVSKPICCPKHIKSSKFPTTRTSSEEWQNKQRVEPQLNHRFSNFVCHSTRAFFVPRIVCYHIECTPSDIGFSGGGMYTFLEILPWRKAFLMSYESVR